MEILGWDLSLPQFFSLFFFFFFLFLLGQNKRKRTGALRGYKRALALALPGLPLINAWIPVSRAAENYARLGPSSLGPTSLQVCLLGPTYPLSPVTKFYPFHLFIIHLIFFLAFPSKWLGEPLR